MANNHTAWSYEAVKDQLAGGKNSRDEGGEDARRNKPLPTTDYAPQYLRDVSSRSDALGHAVGEYHQDAITALLARMRQSPFALDSVSRKVRGAAAGAEAEINRDLAVHAAEMEKLKESASAATLVYNRDLQAADATHPPGGWPNATFTVLLALAVFFCDLLASTFWLRHALGMTNALIAGFVLSLLTILLGYLSACSVLKTLKHCDRTQLGRALQWALASFFFLLALAVLYVGTAYRAALIEGLSEGDALRDIADFHKVLGNFAALALFALGVGGFVFASFKTWTYFHGHRPLLRRSGLAKADADSALTLLENTLKARATQAIDAGTTELADIDAKNAAWTIQIADYVEDGIGIINEANRRYALIDNAFQTITAEYLDGYYEVRPGERIPAPDPFPRADVEVPPVLSRIKDESLVMARDASLVVQCGRAELANILEQAIKRIDEMAGNCASHRSLPMLPER